MKTGYMCEVDYDHELEGCGAKVYNSVAALKKDHPCLWSCGVIKVRVEQIEVLNEEDYD